MSSTPAGRGRRWPAVTQALGRHAVALVAIGFVLWTLIGFLGFTAYQGGWGSRTLEPVSYRLYAAVQLFVLESGAVEGKVPPMLDVARFGAPIVAGYAVVSTVAAMLRSQLDAWRLTRLRGHVVVVALRPEAEQLCARMLDEGRRVVVVSDRGTGAAIGALRARGGIYVDGDARRGLTLRRAGLARAAHLVVLAPDDAATTEVVAQARAIAEKRREKDPLRCVAVLADPDACALMTIQALQDDRPAVVRVDFLNAISSGAHLLLRRHPWSGRSTAVVVTGDGPTAAAVLLSIARESGEIGANRLSVVVAGHDRDALEDLRQQHPELDRLADITVCDDIDEAVASHGELVAYVCDDDTHVAQRVLELGSHGGRVRRTVVVQEQLSALAELLGRRAGAATGAEVSTFSIMDEVCQTDVMLYGLAEQLAQELHETYLRARRGEPNNDDPALSAWEDLPAAFQESNRRQAEHISHKLRALGRAVVPLTGWDEALTALRADDVETLAQLEHQRWLDERIAAGWLHGPRSPERRTSPYLRPWVQLPENVRDYDRQFARQVPWLLASLGLQLAPRATTVLVPGAQVGDCSVPDVADQHSTTDAEHSRSAP